MGVGPARSTERSGRFVVPGAAAAWAVRERGRVLRLYRPREPKRHAPPLRASQPGGTADLARAASTMSTAARTGVYSQNRGCGQGDVGDVGIKSLKGRSRPALLRTRSSPARPPGPIAPPGRADKEQFTDQRDFRANPRQLNEFARLSPLACGRSPGRASCRVVSFPLRSPSSPSEPSSAPYRPRRPWSHRCKTFWPRPTRPCPRRCVPPLRSAGTSRRPNKSAT